MPLTRRSLALPPDPQSVGRARTWVASVLRDLDREDLTETAQLGVSELVTNALMHAEAPVTVRMRGTREHPRIEVVDHTPEPLHPTSIIVATKGDFPATFGRGLTIVAMNAAQWGSERDADGSSKTVWFEPVGEMREEVDIGEIFRSFEDITAEDVSQPLAATVTVRLLNLPARLFARLRHYHFELRREMRLLAFADPGRYPVAEEITELFRIADRDRRATAGVRRLDEAIRQGLDSVDLVYAAPSGAPATMARALELFRECYATFRDDELLAMVPEPALLELQDWYFGEFVRQGRGEPARPWSGDGESRPIRYPSYSFG